MDYLPQYFRHIDWVTYGLIWLNRLSDDPSLSFEQVRDVFTTTSAYRLVSACCIDCDSPIHESLSSPSVGIRNKWNLQKQIAAGIRYAYLKQLDVISVSVNHANPDSGIAHRSSYQLSDGSVYYLELLPSDELPFTAPWILQGGDPSLWYDVRRWSLLRPIAPSLISSVQYPLSSARLFSDQYGKVLSQLGATLSDTSRWFPPPATSNLDMRDYLMQHPKLYSLSGDPHLVST